MDQNEFDAWVSEWNGGLDYNGDSCTVYNMNTESRRKQVVKYNSQKENWDRNKGAWHTMHNATYDIANKTVTIIAQEDATNQYEFELEQKKQEAETSVK